MLLTVNEAMDLEEFDQFDILAGRNGMNNIISKVGILDWETVKDIEEDFVEGEFVINPKAGFYILTSI